MMNRIFAGFSMLALALTFVFDGTDVFTQKAQQLK